MVPLIIKLLQWEFVVTTIVIFFSVPPLSPKAQKICFLT